MAQRQVRAAEQRAEKKLILHQWEEREGKDVPRKFMEGNKDKA